MIVEEVDKKPFCRKHVQFNWQTILSNPKGAQKVPIEYQGPHTS